MKMYRVLFNISEIQEWDVIKETEYTVTTDNGIRVHKESTGIKWFKTRNEAVQALIRMNINRTRIINSKIKTLLHEQTILSEKILELNRQLK